MAWSGAAGIPRVSSWSHSPEPPQPNTLLYQGQGKGGSTLSAYQKQGHREVPASAGEEALFQCTKPRGVPRGPSHLQFP